MVSTNEKLKKVGLNPDRASVIDVIVNNNIAVKGYQKTINGKIVPVKQHDRKGDKKPKPTADWNKNAVSAISAGIQTTITKKKDLIQRKRKNGFTTPPEARKLYAEYKNINKSLKKLVDSLGGIDNARKDDIYNKIVKEQAARVKKYFAMVKAFQKKEGKGQFAGKEEKPEKSSGKRGKKAETTPDDARAILREYKKDLAVIKELVKKLGADEAKNNPEYISRKELNKKRMEEYWRLVKEYQQKEGKGQFGKDGPKEPEKPKEMPIKIKGIEYTSQTSDQDRNKIIGKVIREYNEIKWHKLGKHIVDYEIMSNLHEANSDLEKEFMKLAEDMNPFVIEVSNKHDELKKAINDKLSADEAGKIYVAYDNAVKAFKRQVKTIPAKVDTIISKLPLKRMTLEYGTKIIPELRDFEETLPDNIRKYCRCLRGTAPVYQTSKSNLADDPEVFGKAWNGDQKRLRDEVAGFYKWRNGGGVYLQPDVHHIVAAHEIGHAIHLEYISDTNVGLFNEWSSLYKHYIKQNKPVTRQYAKESENEFFAVAFELYYTRPATLRRNNPDIYELMAKSVPLKGKWSPDKNGSTGGYYRNVN